MSRFLLHTRYIFFLLIFTLPTLTKGQKKYGNEWITYGKPYYKFHTPSEDYERGWTHVYRRDMIYTLDYHTIKASGFPIDTTDPRHIQIYTDGEETAIQIIGEQDGVFNANDYILIYSEHNDTRMDEPLFKNKDHIPMNMTMHSFQKAHFLTYTTDGTLGKRIQKVKLSNNGQSPEISHHNRLSSNLLKNNLEQTNPWVSNSYSYGFNNICYGRVYPEDRIRSRFDIQSIGSGYGAYISYKNEARKRYWRYNTTFLSHFTEGKGFVGAATSVGTVRTQNFDLKGIINPEIRVKVRVIGLLNTPHRVEVVAEDEDANQVTLGEMHFKNYEIATLEKKINTLNVTSSKSKLKIKLKAIQVNATASATARREDWATIETEVYYDQNFGTTGPFWGEKYYGLLHGNITPNAESWYQSNNKLEKYFTLKPNLSGVAKVELNNLPTTAVLYDITDVQNIKVIEPSSMSGSTSTFMIPNAQTGRKLYVSNHTHRIRKVYGEQTYQPVNTNANYLIIYNDLREEPASYRNQYRYTNEVQQYANYRASAAGGGYTVQMSDVDDLFDLFTYGQRTSLALRKFADYMLSHGVKPKALFLIGKGIEYMSEDTFYWNDLPPIQPHVRWINKPCFVPSMGSPSSDHEITAGLAGYPDHVPAIPTGRLSTAHYAKTEVLNYLDKAKAHDAMAYDTPWGKNFVHMSGGQSNAEITQFNDYINHFTSISQANYINGAVSSIQKATASGLSAVQKQDIRDKINQGALLMTMFGHSAATTTQGDLDIGDPISSNQYTNKDKYPMVIMNGCQSGQIFEGRNVERTHTYGPYQYTVGEKWILAKDKGAVLYWAHAHSGYTSTLYAHTANFYETLADKNYTSKTVGEIIQETCRKTMARSGSDPIAVINVQQFVLQGDPALRLFKEQKPDYYVDNTRISMVEVSGQKITTKSSQFSLAIDVSNLGLADLTSLEVQVRRVFPNGTSVTYPIQIFDYIPSRKVIQFHVQPNINSTNNIIGTNQFYVTLDPKNKIQEIKKTNNVGKLSYFFPEKDLKTIAPQKYSILNKAIVKLIAQRTNSQNVNPANFIFQLDTVGNFANPIKDTTLTGVVIPSWETNLPHTDQNKVWYWRVRNLNNPDQELFWASSSFVYDPADSAGWSQQHNYQFKESKFDNLTHHSSTNSWSFTSANTSSGAVTSSLIGTATYWDKLTWILGNHDDLADQWELDIIGVTANKQETVLFSNVVADQQKANSAGTEKQYVFDLSNRINIQNHPYLRLRLRLKDPTKKTPIPLKMWRVTYKKAPELVVLPPNNNTPTVVTSGGNIVQNLNILNLGGSTDGVVVIKYIVTNQNTGKVTVLFDTLKTPNAGDTTKININLPTDNLDEGKNDVQVIVNPPDTAQVNTNKTPNLSDPIYYPNPELDLTNNSLDFIVIVKSDRINPLLDVLVDGRYLMNEDIVAANPIISIDLKDEHHKNKFIDATSHLEVYLSRCETCSFQRIDLRTSDSISWSIAENNHHLSVQYKPATLPDGIYTLKVLGTDASGNSSGIVPYQISFRVVNKTSISHFYPYPNPVIDKTQFVFTLTGEVPENIRIRIITPSGKVVRTVTQQDLGNVHVGHNVSEFMWDGTDEYGDKLANGVYLYRVDVKSSKNFSTWNTAGDKFFKKGYGKIYLMK